MYGRTSPDVDMQEKILEILRQEGVVPVYKLAKSLGLTYGGAQWHIDRLECPLSAPRRLRGLEARLGRAALGLQDLSVL
jgi:predicted ArsR family transcriptional regulator